MKLHWATTCVLVAAVIVEVSMEKCHKQSLKNVCWAKLNGTNFCPKFTTNSLICSDFNQLEYNSEIVEDITSIEVRNNSVFNIIYAGLFGNFGDKIQLVNITNSNIIYIEDEAFVNVGRTKYLFINGNHIEILSGGIFRSLNLMEVLDLSGNKIRRIVENFLYYNPNLKELNLNHNRIYDSSFWTGICIQLTSLDLSDNEIETLELPKCSNLKYLNIAGNKIRSLEGSNFGNKSLIYLDVSNNKISNIDDEFLKNFHALETLNLSRNPLFSLNGIPIHFFQSTSMLRTLNLSSTSLSKLNTGVLSPLEKLEILDLSSNSLKFLPKHLLFHLHNLSRLYLNDNLLTYFDSNVLPSDHGREFNLNLDDNKWHCETLGHIYSEKPYYVNMFGKMTSDTANINGLSCQTDMESILDNQPPTGTNLTSLQRSYLWSLVNSQRSIKKTFAELKIYLNHSNLEQRYYPKDYLKRMQNSLLVRDIVLFSIFVAGVTIVAIFVLIYHGIGKKSRHQGEEGDFLRSMSIPS